MTHSSAASRPIEAVARRLSSAKRVLAVTHTNPDGDAVGSLVGLGHILASLGAETRLYCETPIPDYLGWLNSPTAIGNVLPAPGAWRPDCVVFLDCADQNRAGPDITGFIAACRETSLTDGGVDTLCIDHHMANPLFADISWVDPSMSATGAMVALLAKELRFPLRGDLGEAVYLAIVSDTGSFSYANTTPLVLELAAEIVKNGLSVAALTGKYENNWTLDRMHLWGELMKDVLLLCDGKIVLSVVTEEQLARHNAPRLYLEGYASWLRRLANTKVVVLSRTDRSNGSKISLRSMGDLDVQKIAAVFGGGGHKGAAGIDMIQKPSEAAALVLEAVYSALGADSGRDREILERLRQRDE